MRRVSGFACSVWLLLCVAHAHAQVTVITRSAQDVEVQRQLGVWLEVPVQARAEPAEREPAEIIADAMQRAAPGYLVVVDRRSSNVHVLRPSDQTAVARALPAEVLRDSHSAVALTAAEMLEWLGAVPSKRAPPSVAAADDQHAATAAAARATWGVALGADIELRDSPGFDVSLVRPSLHAELQLRPAAWGSLWLGVAGRVSPLGSWERAPSTALVASGVERVQYEATDAALMLALGHDSQGATVVAELGAGLSFADVHARDLAGRVLGRDQSTAAYLGLGAGLRYELVWGFALAAGAELQWLARPTRYAVGGVRALEEGPLRLAARMGLIWQSAH